ncbi:MerR family transcriptional regulator [Arthrobacter sp. NPDC090010]|uniref:MerR family transcriptional regulator n=1 Tax=Arthrobacter sp. NPDC090010 TaxID=3363942 RepID=UPI0037F156D5
MTETYSIGTVAERLGLTIDTLRYYERAGIVPPAHRDSGGRRRYGSNDLHLLEVLLHLRDTGMPLSTIAEFTRLVQSDPEGVPERLQLLRAHRAIITEQIARLNRSLAVVESKISDYSARSSLREKRA